MGQYLSVAIATEIWVENRCGKEKVLKDMKENFDLSIYDFDENKGENYCCFRLKKDLFCKEIVQLFEELKPYANKYTRERWESCIEEVKSIEDKNFDGIIETAKGKGLSYLEGNIFCNNISYLGDSEMFCDTLNLVYDGKIVMECYERLFIFLRNSIIGNLKSPLKSSIVITLIG